MNSTNLQTVRDIYAAFGARAIDQILARVTPETAWDFAGGRPDRVPWHRPVRGRAELPRFFEGIATHVEFSKFEPREFVHGGAHVVVTVHMAYKVLATGRVVEIEQVHWWTFENALVARMRHYEDTATVVEAATGSRRSGEGT